MGSIDLSQNIAPDVQLITDEEPNPGIFVLKSWRTEPNTAHLMLTWEFVCFYVLNSFDSYCSKFVGQQDLGFSATQKNFIAFSGGASQCAGAEFSKLLLALCIHELVTKYR